MRKKSLNEPGQKTVSKPQHHMEIGIKKPDSSQVLAARKITLRDRFLNAIFGDGHKMVIMVPGESVGTISITEMDEQEMKTSEVNKVRVLGNKSKKRKGD